MSDQVKHECGIAMLRLLKPPRYYFEKYGTWSFGLNRMYLMMEKQHNRGQDGAGLAGVKLDTKPGTRYIFRHRSNGANPIKEVFENVKRDIERSGFTGLDDQMVSAQNISEIPFACDLYLGHLRYGTFGNYNLDYVHPVIRENNWRSRNLVLAGNFNLTNVGEVFDHLIEVGQSPVDFSDTVTVLENLGHFLDEEVAGMVSRYKNEGYSKREISPLVEANLDIVSILRNAGKRWDGGYAMAGMTGYGDSFVVRDPHGIRPAFWYKNDELVVIASERPVLQTVFNLKTSEVNELEPGHAIITRTSGKVSIEKISEEKTHAKCSFERIYFSRGTDKDIYRERKKLGEQLTNRILEAIDGDIENTVFSYIPNTAESAFYGLVKGVEDNLNRIKIDQILKLGNNATHDQVEAIISRRPRVEKIAVKDAKLRTFITEDRNRDDLVGHVYDVTYGVIRRGIDKLVILDDSIVRGTTLKKSIISILDRLEPSRIVVASSSPQIRYPDCYGIDMAKLGDFIAFRAAIELLKDQGKESIIEQVYQKALLELKKANEEMINVVKEIYKPFTAEEISGKISSMLRSDEIKAEVKVVYQSIEGLHEACPENKGDWYFTGNYPTPGGNSVVNRSFVNFIEGKTGRAY